MAAITGTDLSVIDESLSSLKGEMEEIEMHAPGSFLSKVQFHQKRETAFLWPKFIYEDSLEFSIYFSVHSVAQPGGLLCLCIIRSISWTTAMHILNFFH